MRDTIAATGLDLSGLTVLTEAATGSYSVTPVIAALAGARRVYALTRSTRYGSVAEVTEWTNRLALVCGVAERITILEQLPADVLSEVDIVTNSGHLRPINAQIIENLPQRAVIGLMFEAWEFRVQDIDVVACQQRGIPVVGVNERDPAVDVFSYLGPLCVKLLHEAGIPVYRNRLALLCDNEFAPSIARGLTGLGAEVQIFSAAEDLKQNEWDAVVVALKPANDLRIGAREAALIAAACPAGTLVAQFWGDVDREALHARGLVLWPPSPPALGHMAILLSAIGPDSIVRLQTGGLRAAEWVFRGNPIPPGGIAQTVDLSSVSS
jgi:hypothetical protein